MEIAMIGLGKMGFNLGLNLKHHQHQVFGYDISAAMREDAAKEGITTFDSIEATLHHMTGRKVVWLMVPSGAITETVIEEVIKHLSMGDILIEGGNSNFNDSIRRAKAVEAKGIHYLDVGTSGGTSGANQGACLMIGGNQTVFKELEPLFEVLSVEKGYMYAGAHGAGHFLKMVHNGIEYGMMQAIGEGFDLVKQSSYDYDLEAVATVWDHGSVIRGWLMSLCVSAFNKDALLEDIRGIAHASGEAQWMVETALEMNVAVPVTALSLFTRMSSQDEVNFTMKVVAALRNEFGGHAVIKK